MYRIVANSTIQCAVISAAAWRGGCGILSKEKLKAKGHEVEYQCGQSGGEVVATGGSGGEAVTIHNVQQWNQYLL